MNGILQNIKFENFEHTVTGSYGGVVGYSNQYGRYNNVHVKNARAIKDFILEASEQARIKRRTLNTLDIGSGQMADVDTDTL